MAYFAGIDGGQSATVAVVGDEQGRILGRGSAGPADEVAQGAESTRLRDALAGALSDAIAKANLPADTRFGQIVAGISGYEGHVYGRPPQLPADSFTLEHDAPIAHAGALAGEPGVVVIAGTGSVAYALNERGESALVGGWGYLFGDEGSAFWLARDAISDAMRDRDAGEHNSIADVALRHFNVASLRKLARSFYVGTISRAQLASFAEVVIQLAETGNERAVQYVIDGAAALVTLATHAIRQANLHSPKVAFIGGMLSSATMRNHVAHRVRELLPDAEHVEPAYDPAVGALLLAYKAGGFRPQRIA